MSPLQTQVRTFHKVFGGELDEGPTPGNIRYRLKLISEEFKEVVEAAYAAYNARYQKRGAPTVRRNDAHLAKELGDLMYVLAGTFTTFGWDMDEALRLIHESNMTKLDEDGKPQRREDGKVLKGPNYEEPDMEKIVA